MKKLLLLGLVLLLLSGTAAAKNVSDETASIFDKINQYNLDLAKEQSVKITFLVAFLAGVLSIFAPCILPFLPAFFAVTFKEKTRITKMTFMFFLGFATTFTILGTIAGVLGQQTLAFFPYKKELIAAVGIVIIIFGILTLLGKGFYFIRQPNVKTKNDALGVYLFGLVFALGWAACLGPVLGGILAIGAILQNYLQAALLLLAYAFGVAVPLFILAFFFDKTHIHAMNFMKKTITIGKFKTLLPSFISGLLLIVTGLVFVFLEATDILNASSFFGLKQKFFDWQRLIIDWPYANAVGLIVLVIIVGLIIYFWKRNHKN